MVNAVVRLMKANKNTNNKSIASIHVIRAPQTSTINLQSKSIPARSRVKLIKSRVRLPIKKIASSCVGAFYACIMKPEAARTMYVRA